MEINPLPENNPGGDLLTQTMMKKTMLTYVLILSAISVFTQKWEQLIGIPNQNEESRRIIEHYDMGYIITAFLGEGNEQYGWLVKTDINGDVMWDITIGVYPDRVLIDKTVYDEQGNLYVFGLLVQNFEAYRPMILKLNACGELLWCKSFHCDGYEAGFFTDGIILNNGDLLALASMPDETLHEMIFLFCISSEGEYKWKKSYASKDDHPLFSTRLGSRIQFYNDIYIISGYVYSPHPNYPTIASLRPMFIGVDTMFNEQWVLEFGMEENMKGKAVESIAINDSIFMGMGRYRYNDSTGETKNAWAMIYNKQGEQTGNVVITKEQLGNEVNESTFYEVEKINDSLYLGSAGYFFGEEETTAGGEIVFDTAGNVYNYTIIENLLGPQNLAKTFDNKYLVSTSYWYPDLSFDISLYKLNKNLESDTVYPGNYTYDSLCTELPVQSGVIDLSGCSIVTSVEEIPTLEEYYNRINKIIVNTFPNPANDGSVTLSFQNTEYFQNIELKCFDVFGKEIHAEKVYQYQGESEIDISQLQAGVYFAIVYSDGKSAGECKFVVQ